MCLWQTDLCACRDGSQFACCKNAFVCYWQFFFSHSLSLPLSFCSRSLLLSVPSSGPGPQLGLLWSWTQACFLPDNWQMLWKASVLLFSAAPVRPQVCIGVCASHVCVERAAATHVFMASCSSLLPRASGGKASRGRHPLLPSVPTRSGTPPPPTTSPLLLPFPFLVSESQPPATSLRRSESCLGSREMGPAVCETTDMRYEKWEMREQTDTHSLTHSHKHSRTHIPHTNTHTHTNRGLYSRPGNILGWINSESDRSTCLSLWLWASACEASEALWHEFDEFSLRGRWTRNCHFVKMLCRQINRSIYY